ncbi:MAG: hypothetical protein QM772_16710 [Ottowia sp.]|uniref:hypothetical protein n=1 Tax=Ottowia sp. TaxID=1898956 RepID=UPI0039E22171
MSARSAGFVPCACRCASLLIAVAGAATPHAAPVLPSASCNAVWAATGLSEVPGDHLLVVLSPRMVYALIEWPRMREAAVSAGFSVTVARDPRVPPSEWSSAVEAAGLPELSAAPRVDADLAGSCGLLNHFPSTLVGRCGRPHPWPILGVMPDAAWRSLLVQRRDAMACP